MAFYNRMRDSVRDLGSFGGGSGAGGSDNLSQMGSLNLLDKLQHFGGNRIGRIPPPNPKVNPYGRAVDPTKGPMNVVYDRGPEEFAQQQKQRSRQLDIEEKKVGALEALKGLDLGIKQQNANTNLMRAQTTDRVRDMTDEEKMQALLEKALGVEGVRQGGANQRTDKVIAGRATEGEANRGVTRSEGQANRTSAENRTQMTVTGAQNRQDDAQAFDAGKPGPLAQQLKGKIEDILNKNNGKYNNLVEWDDEAKAYRVKPPRTGGIFGGGEDLATAALRAEFNRALYGPAQTQINQGASQGLRTPTTVAGTNQRPTGNAEPMTKTQVNSRTGATRTLVSNDGGMTWVPR